MKLRLGVIGCGGMSENHAKGFQEMKEQVEITAVCDVVAQRAEKAAQVFGADFVTTDYHEMTERVDAVLVVLPHDLHYEVGLYFIRKKKHVLMEKPLCNSEEECRRLIAAAKEEQVVLMTAYPVRFWPGIVQLKEIVDSKTYGEVIQMSVWTEQHTEAEETNWMNTARLGGGQFFSHGCHYVDLLLWFLGEPVEGVHIGTRQGTPWMMREGTSNVILKFQNGATAYHFGTWGARGTKMGYNFQIHFEKGLVEFSYDEGEINLYQGPSIQSKRLLWKDERERGKNTQFEILHFADCIRSHKRPLTDGESSLKGLQVIWRLYDAEKNHTVADLTGLGLKE